MGEVSYIEGGVILTERNQNDKCVELLESLLQKAKDGEVIGINVAIQYADGSNGSTGAGFIYNNRQMGALMTEVFKLAQG